MEDKYKLRSLTDEDREYLFQREEHFMVPADRQLTDEQKGRLHRVVALRDFGDVMKGDIGGFVEWEHGEAMDHTTDFPPISHEDESWLYDDSIMINRSLLSENSKVHNDSFLSRGRISNSEIDNSTLHQARVSGSTIDRSRVSKVGVVVDNSEIRNSSIQKVERIHESVLNGATLRCGPNWDGAAVLGSTIDDSIIINRTRVDNGTHLKDSRIKSSTLDNSLVVGADLQGMKVQKSDIHHSQMKHANVIDRVVYENKNIRDEEFPSLSEGDILDLDKGSGMQK